MKYSPCNITGDFVVKCCLIIIVVITELSLLVRIIVFGKEHHKIIYKVLTIVHIVAELSI